MADVNKLELLASASVDTLVARASDPGSTLSALEAKLEAGLAEAEAAVIALPDRLEALEARLEAERATAAKCDAIVARSEADGRADLARAAQDRKARALASAQAIEQEIAQAQSDGARLDALMPALEARLDEVRGRLAALPASARRPEPTPAPAPAAPAPAAAADGDEGDWEKELAALMASMGVSPTPAGPGASGDDDDDPMAGIPDLVEVPEDALPEGEELPPEPQPARAAAPAVARGAAPPAASPAAKSPAKPPAEGGGGRAGLWITLLVALGAAGGAVWWFFLR